MKLMLCGFALLAGLSETGAVASVTGLEGVLGTVQSVVSSLPIAEREIGGDSRDIPDTLNSIIVGTAGGLPITVPLLDGALLASPHDGIAPEAEVDLSPLAPSLQ